MRARSSRSARCDGYNATGSQRACSVMTQALDELIGLAGRVLARLDAVLPQIGTPDWATTKAAVWHLSALGGELRAHTDLDPIDLDDLMYIDRQKQRIEANTAQFVRGFPA